MGHEAALGGFVVVRRHQQQGVRAQFFGLLGELDAVGRVVRARARNDRDPAGGLLDGGAHDADMFLMGEGGRLAGGAAGDDRIGAAFDLPLDEFPVLFIVDAAVGLHRGDDGDAGAGKNRLLTHIDSPHSKCRVYRSI